MKCTIRLIYFAVFLLPFTGRADIFHYANVLAGDRAMGLGGAFTAISDDASGVIYNPAGLAFALSNDISASANAFYTKETNYKKTLGDNDFLETAGGSVAPFFGSMAKLDHLVEGLSFGFGIQTLDSELKNQNDLVKDAYFQSGKYNEGPKDSPELEACYTQKEDQYIKKLYRSVNARASTQSFGAALGYRLTGSLAVGLGLNYLQIDELVQEYQANDINKGDCSGGRTSPQSVTTSVRQNIRTHLKAGALVPNFGVQYSMNSGFSFGLSIKPSLMIADSYEYTSEVTSFIQLRENNTLTAFQDAGNTDISIEKPLGALPIETRFGMAWFASQRLLVSMDVSYFSESKSGNTTKQNANGEVVANIGNIFMREAVTNFALGTEYYVTPSYPLRLGFFTNNDARPMLEKAAGSRDSVNYNGISAFITKVTPNDQVALGTIIQVGEGKAQKTGIAATQDVEAYSAVLAFSASHNF